MFLPPENDGKMGVFESIFNETVKTEVEKSDRLKKTVKIAGTELCDLLIKKHKLNKYKGFVP